MRQVTISVPDGHEVIVQPIQQPESLPTLEVPPELLAEGWRYASRSDSPLELWTCLPELDGKNWLFGDEEGDYEFCGPAFVAAMGITVPERPISESLWELVAKSPSSGWIPANGERPDLSDDTKVEVMFCNGVKRHGEVVAQWVWEHTGSAGDIVAYRVVERGAK